MKFISVCSGIEAASAAWTQLGWQAVAFSEIDPFPCAVLKHHYPDVPNWGDMTKFKDWPNATIDVLCGGTPCQSFSVAGFRKGLDDPRGNLMLTFGSIAAKYRPKWLVWENVPGVLSSNGGRDFGAFLGMLGQLGYGFAYRVLDAQFFGVAQRRKRVFVVGCIGDWRSAAAVLFERQSLSGHPAPIRKSRQDVAGTIGACTTESGGLGTDFDLAGGLQVAGTIESSIGRTRGAGISPGVITPIPHADISTTLKARDSKCPSSDGDGAIIVPICFDTTQITSAANRSNPKQGDPCHSLAAGAHAPAIAFPANLSATQHASTENLSPSLGAVNPTAVAVSLRGRDGGAMAELGDEISNALMASGGVGDKAHVIASYTTKLHNTASNQAGKIYEEYTVGLDRNSPPPALLSSIAVRRLTPTECERLQGFPDIKKKYRIQVCYEADKTVNAPSVEQSSAAPSHDQIKHAVVHVQIKLDRQEFQLLSPERLHFCASTAESQNSSRYLMQSADIVHLVAIMTPHLDQLTGVGKAELQANTAGFSLHQSGSRSVHLSGQEIAALASDADNFTKTMNDCLRSITSEVGRNSQNYEQSIKTLCCCVVAAINSYIPDGISPKNLFDLNIETSIGYTAIPWRNKPTSECPVGLRYKSIGNSWAVPVAHWIGQRIEAVEAILSEQRAEA